MLKKLKDFFKPEQVKKIRDRPLYNFNYKKVSLYKFILKLKSDPFAFKDENLELIYDDDVYWNKLNSALSNITVDLYFKPYKEHFKGVDLSHINAIKVKFYDGNYSDFFANCRLPKYVDFDFSDTLYIRACIYMCKVQNVRIRGNLIKGNILIQSLWCLDFEERNKNDTFNFEYLVNYEESIKRNMEKGNSFQETLDSYKMTNWHNYHKVNKFTTIKDNNVLPESYYIDLLKEYPEFLI